MTPAQANQEPRSRFGSIGAVHSRFRLQTTASDFRTLLAFCLFGTQEQGYRERVEDRLRAETQSARAVFTNQGRVGIYAAIKAAVSGTRTGIVMSPYTLYEVVNMVLYAGGRPVFVDTLPDTPSVGCDDIERLIDPQTAAVMLTHYHLPVPETPQIAELAAAKGVPLIEDAAVSFGARLDGRPIGTFGDAGAFSFGLFKVINAFYGGGLIGGETEFFERIDTTLADFAPEHRKRLALRAAYGLALDLMTHPLPYSLVTLPLLRRAQASEDSFLARFTRADARPEIAPAYPDALKRQPTEVQAELVWKGLERAEAERAIREQRAGRYLEGLSEIDEIGLPEMPANAVGSWTEFPIVTHDRDALYRRLLDRGQDVRYYYYRNCADLRIYQRDYRDCPNARKLMFETLMLPLYPRYPDEQIERNIEVIREHFGK